MALPRAFVGFSSTDLHSYRLMLAWKAHEHIEFNFADCQLLKELNSEDEDYIKLRCRARINMAGTYLMLIGADTRSKHRYVRWEAEVALEKECRIIGVNLDGWRKMNKETCPPVIQDIGAIFVPFSPQIVAYALAHARWRDSKNWNFKDGVYTKLGYALIGNHAERKKSHNPFL